MTQFNEEIKLKTVDKNHVEKDNSFEEAYAIYGRFNSIPHTVWNQIFHEYWNGMLFSGKRNISLDGNMVRIVFGKGDDLQTHINFLKQVIEHTNKRYGEYIDTEARNKEEEEAKKEQIEKVKDELKEKLKEIQL